MVGSPLISELAVLTESGMRPGSTPSASCTTTTPGDRTPPPTEAEYDGGGSVLEGGCIAGELRLLVGVRERSRGVER